MTMNCNGSGRPPRRAYEGNSSGRRVPSRRRGSDQHGGNDGGNPDSLVFVLTNSFTNISNVLAVVPRGEGGRGDNEAGALAAQGRGERAPFHHHRAGAGRDHDATNATSGGVLAEQREHLRYSALFEDDDAPSSSIMNNHNRFHAVVGPQPPMSTTTFSDIIGDVLEMIKDDDFLFSDIMIPAASSGGTAPPPRAPLVASSSSDKGTGAGGPRSILPDHDKDAKE
eukprot:CAMPEP_0119546692 /NCGR_PEP_ID=MMETSP1352-20130426/1001_1 /TAXON_ID=265584 /ORGANISM="Stauroneis constricta, Strain CCMP1120" /LENGTH=224 /DNA_ID=CAMNT_0007591417 /DNA_START=64 /DNA_END=738 /DNA_ORIENTATION=+